MTAPTGYFMSLYHQYLLHLSVLRESLIDLENSFHRDNGYYRLNMPRYDSTEFAGYYIGLFRVVMQSKQVNSYT